MQLAKRLLPLAVVLTAWMTAACTGAPGSNPSGALAVEPASSEVFPGDTIQFSALLDSAPADPITWSVKESGGGMIQADGTYVAPDAVGTYTIVATHESGELAEATVLVTERAAQSVRVSVSPKAASIQAGATLELDASVTGTAVTTVTWSVEEGQAGGAVTAAGTYTAPANAGTYHLVVRSTATPAAMDRATITVTPGTPPPPPPTGPQLYVATDGNDASPGTEAQPWRTIQKAMNAAAPGSTVNVKAGTYRERLTLNVTGSSDKPIVFQPYGFAGAPNCGGFTGRACGGDKVVLDYANLGTVTDGVPFLRINGKSYVTIQGFTFQNLTCYGAMQQGVRIDGASSYIDLRHNKFLNNRNTYPSFDGAAAMLHIRVWGPSHHVTFFRNELGNIVTVMSEALTLDSNARDVLVEQNWLHDVDGIGIDTHGAANHITIRGNLLEFIGQKRDGGIWYNNPSNAIYNDGGNSILIERNTVRDSNYAIAVVTEPNQPLGHDVIVRNNLAYRNSHAGVMVGNWYSSDGSNVFNVQVLNNTLVDNGNGFFMRPFQGNTVVWKGNILANNDNNIANPLGSSTGTMDYNLYFGGGATGPDAHKLTGDPRFVNAAGGDFSLQPGSPATDAGDPSATVDANGAVDLRGDSRIVNGKIDIGAVEAR